MYNEEISVIIREATENYYFRKAKTIIEVLKDLPIFYKTKNNTIITISYTDSKCYYDIANREIITIFHGETADVLKLEDFCVTWAFRKEDLK